jgi:hypothetical protein
MNNNDGLNIGEDSVVIGNVTGKVGNRSVVINATDQHGNVIVPAPYKLDSFLKVLCMS